LVVLTGARQTGKTTLARSHYPQLRYVNLDSLEDRESLREIAAARWGQTVGPAILDEAQKQPELFDKVKYAYDDGAIDFTVLLGSSRFSLLEGVRESLAGRAFVYELWPLMPSEILHAADETPPRPLFDALLHAQRPEEVLQGTPAVLLGEDAATRREAWTHLATWGGMPELLRLDDSDRRRWLASYQQTFLERDLLDLTRLRDLEPFRALQRLCMLRTGGLLSYADLGRDAGVSAATARRYIEYLRLSYQVVLLQPFRRNLTSSLVKAPRIYWLDLGLLRQTTKQWGALDGSLFETLVVAELHKWSATLGTDAELYAYRTRSGLELDLLVKVPRGLIGIEIKSRERAVPGDCRALRSVARAAGDEWLMGLVIYRGRTIQRLDEETRVWAVPHDRLL
jgi:hypothetical protein